MKSPLFLIAALVIASTTFAQQRIKGKVLDSLTLQPIESAVIKIIKTNAKTAANKNGDFVLNNVKGDSLLVTRIGYQPKIVKTSYGKPVVVVLARGVITLRDITITNSVTLKTYSALSELDLNMQPAKSAQDLLRLVPGLFIAQHQKG
jgi:hypothetical protein